MSSISSIVNQNNLQPRVAQDNKISVDNVVNEKDVRIKGQDQDNFVNLATSQNQEAEQGDQQFAHQHHIALNAYRFFGREGENSDAQGQIKVIAPEQKQNAAQQAQAIKERVFPNSNTKSSEESSIETTVGNTSSNTGESTVGKTQNPESKDEKKVGHEAPKKSVTGKELTEEELAEIKDLKDRDREVRIHEQAHKSAGGSYASAPKFDFVTGPDGRRYADGGHVDIDVSEESDPKDTIAKMQVVKRAALAPQEPSAQDRKVFAEASQKEASARQELAKIEKEEAETKQQEAASASNTQMSPVQTPAQKREATENENRGRRADVVTGLGDDKNEIKPIKVKSHTPQPLSAGKELDNNSIMNEGKNA